MNIAILNGNIFDSNQRKFYKSNILIKDNLISEISQDDFSSNYQNIINAENLYVLPGFIDLHCHLREPGETEKETISTGTRAAAKGGYTRVVAMANTKPVIDNEEDYKTTQEIINKEALISVIQAGAITRDLLGKEVSELLNNFDLRVYSDDGKCLYDKEIFSKAISLARNKNALLILHEEDSLISGNGVINDCALFKENNIPGIPSRSESSAVERDITISNYFNYSSHVTHISSKETINVLKKYKERKYKYSADVTPHHIFFKDEDIDINNSNFKVNPPIRSSEDRDSLIEAIKNDIVQCIATDHAPHTKKQKMEDFIKAPFGISGFETAFAAAYTSLVESGNISFENLIPLFTSNPAKILNLTNEGSIQPGMLANLSLVSLEEVLFSEDMLISKGKNSPFIGCRLKGFPVMTIFGGEIVYKSKN